MKRIEIVLIDNSETIVLEGAEAGYSIKSAGEAAYVSAWRTADNMEETVVVPLYSVKKVRFTLTK